MMSKLISDLLLVGVIAIAFYKNKKYVYNFKAIDLLGAIMMCINWQDAETAGHNKIDSLREKNVSFRLSTLRWCRKSK